jgi:hypothetical protein
LAIDRVGDHVQLGGGGGRVRPGGARHPAQPIPSHAGAVGSLPM